MAVTQADSEAYRQTQQRLQQAERAAAGYRETAETIEKTKLQASFSDGRDDQTEGRIMV
jgi:hypothetical protein